MRAPRLLLGLVLLLPVACTSGADKPDFRPSLQSAGCPDDVEVTFLSRHECSYLTVLQDRSQPGGATVRLLVAKVWPVGSEPLPGITTGFGGNVGDPRGLAGGIAAGATRSGHVVVELESRGAGPHSTPSLTCPEVDALDGRAAVALTGDADLSRDFLAAVRACRARLTEGGVDVADYDVGESAADVEDLRVALGIDGWAHVGSQGTQSRVAFEYLRRYPDRVQAASLDSPAFPGVDDLTAGVTGTRAALAALFSRCAQDSACQLQHPDLQADWERALQRLAAEPLSRPADADGPAVVVDAGKLLRTVKAGLGGDGPGALAALPDLIGEAAAGRMHPELARLVAADPLHCSGYRPFCAAQDGFAWGAYLTSWCRDQLPFQDRAALRDAVGADPAWKAVFLDDPYTAACDAWDVPAAPAAAAEPVDTPVPLLLLTGQLDASSPFQLAQDTAARLDRAWAVEVPGHTHNVLGSSECAISIRDAWRLAPTVAPAETSCLGGN